MRPPYIRCMINSPYRYYNKETGSYDRNRHLESLVRLLQYCTDRHICVIFGEYNPPSFEMRQDQKWIDMSVDYLNYLVNERHLTCIKYFVIFNEPDGDWAAPNGDYLLWKDMLFRFHRKMKEYPGLIEKVKLAGPDVVTEYKNPHSDYDSKEWVSHTAADADSIIGIYDVHAYPGQKEVRKNDYVSFLSGYKDCIPKQKQIVLGEAGYKYWRKEDAELMKEYNRRLMGHPFTKGSDCNMLCYDFFYGIDMSLLAMKVMNAGFSGVAMWMLDDAMHSNGDSGKPQDIKIWGLWNILGEEVFGHKEEENLRPCFYPWSLMCRYFPADTNIMRIRTDSYGQNIYAVAGVYNGKMTVAVVNYGEKDQYVHIRLPFAVHGAVRYSYAKNQMKVNGEGFPEPTDRYHTPITYLREKMSAQSFILLTNIE